MAAEEFDRLCRRIVEGIPEAVVAAGADGTIRLWNSGAERIFGHAASEVVGKPMDLIIPEKLRGRHWEGWRRVMETGVTKYGADLLAVPAIRKDGSRISIEFSILLLRDGGGKIDSVVAVVRDVTARWEKEKALKERLAALEGKKT